MRSPKPNLSGGRISDILWSFSAEQLAWIGAVAMAYNDAEDWLQLAFINCGHFPGDNRYLTAQLSTGSLPTLVVGAIRGLLGSKTPQSKKIILYVERTLIGDGFTQLKKWRDAVIHARLVDMHHAIGWIPNKGRREAVLLSESALEGLYHRLATVSAEMREIVSISSSAYNISRLSVGDDPNRAQLEESIQVASRQLDRLQKIRKSLPPLPKFPEEPRLFRVDLQKTATRLTPKLLK